MYVGPTEQGLSSGLATSQLCSFKQVFFFFLTSPSLSFFIYKMGTLLLFSRSVMSNSLWSHGLQHPRLPCPSLSPWVYSNSVHWISDAIQPSLPLLAPSPLALTLSQHQGLFQCVCSSHQVAKVLIHMTIISTTAGKNALRNGAALIVKTNKQTKKPVWNEVLWWNLKNDRIISVCFQGKPLSITIIQVYAPTTMLKKLKMNSSMNTYKNF